jgi:acyl-CoA synthetase (NDP forming)
VTIDEDVANALRSAAAEGDKTCLATFLGMRGVDDGASSVRGTGGEGEGAARAIPLYPLPEDAARALAAATKYGQWRARDRGTPVAPTDINRRVAEDVVETVLSIDPSGRRLTQDEATALLGAYGIHVWPQVLVRSVEEAVAAADAVGYPVVLKAAAPTLRHAGGTTGVRIDLQDAAAIRAAWASLTDRLAPLESQEFLVQRMATPGVMTRITADEDPLFGPVISFSIAGLPADLLGDIAYRIPPLTDVDVSELISATKASPVLHGHRGATPVHRAALADLIARVSVLADDMPEIASLVLNPANAHPGGVEVLGVEITVAPPARRTDPGRRALT